MRRTEQLQGLRLMKFEDVYGRCYRGDLSQAEASEILGMSERTFRRWRERYEAEGAAGLYDRRLGRVSARRAPVDEVMRVLELFETRYPDFTATGARRNKLLGLWAAKQMGISGVDAEAYAKQVVIADFEEPGDADVLRKVLGDLTGKPASIQGIPLDDDDRPPKSRS